MKIIYTYESDAADTNVMSGYPCSILGQLERRGHEVVRIFPLRQSSRYLFAWKHYWHARRGQTYRPDREPIYLRSLARQIERRTRAINADLLVGAGSHVLAALETPHPKVFVADATFANVLDFYDSFENCTPEFIEQGHELEHNALSKCAAAFYPSEWAARSAIEDYGASPAKVHVIPWGANIEPPAPEVVKEFVMRRSCDRLRILFIGRDWLRKGMPTVLSACGILRRRGVPLSLAIVGFEQVPVGLPDWARLYGLLDKNDPEQNRILCDLLLQSHVLFVPSRAENYGMVFCEAAAYGVPSLTTAVGGITTAVRPGVTGFTLPRHSSPAAFADILQQFFESPELYQRMAFASLEDYHSRVNWSVFATRFLEVCTTLVQGCSPTGKLPPLQAWAF